MNKKCLVSNQYFSKTNLTAVNNNDKYNAKFSLFLMKHPEALEVALYQAPLD
jgi:hypothetical protein